MKLLAALHDRVYGRRIRVLVGHLAAIVPRGASVLDVGAGDGAIARALSTARSDLRIRAVDMLVRPTAVFPVEPFDGNRLPYDDATFDTCVLVDTLHHAENPIALLKEAARVSRQFVVVKDHTLQGFLAGPTLGLMDVVGNARHGVPSTFHYLGRPAWKTAFEQLGLEERLWIDELGLYLWPLGAVFERKLHFVTKLEKAGAPLCEDPTSLAWELAYVSFETLDEEVAKFSHRLRWAGAASWPRDARIVEIFCGRGNGLTALERLGFTNIEGMDLSPRLLSQYRGGVKCHVGDCRSLPFPPASKDVVIVQGGLHHLENIAKDLPLVLNEARRVLVPGGIFVMIEPWPTPFLRLVHWISDRAVLRLGYPKLDYFRRMALYEQSTYRRWLEEGNKISEALRSAFTPIRSRRRLGKWAFVGRPVKPD